MGFIKDIADLVSNSSRKERKKQHELKMLAFDRAEVHMKAAWEAADNDRFRGAGWMTSRLSMNSNIENDLQTLWDRSEDLYRNDSYAASAINGRVDNVIGSGVLFHSRIKSRGDDLINESDAQNLNETREKLFRLWARKDRFVEKQRLFERSKALFGEGLAVMSDYDFGDGRPIPLTWTIINPRRLETPPEFISDPLVRLGIRFRDDSFRVVSGYYIKDIEQNDNHQWKSSYSFFDAWRVQHSFECLVPGQIRGVAWLAPVMGRLKDIKDFSEAKLIAEQVTACTTTFISCGDPAGRATGAATGMASDGARIQELSPGTINYLNEDDVVSHIDPNRPGNSFAPYIEHQLMGVAAGIRYPYALLTKDFRKSSFANGRIEMADGRKSFEGWQQSDIEDAFAPVAERATLEMVIFGLLPNVDASTYRVFERDFNAHQFKPPRWRMAVNPLQEAKADETDVRNGFSSRTDKCDERGYDFEETLMATEREETLTAEKDARILNLRRSLGLVPSEEDPLVKTQQTNPSFEKSNVQEVTI